MYNIRNLTMTLALCAVTLSFGAQADDDFHGIVESRPASGHVGDWVIGGRTFTATAATEIEADDGPLDVGACASVDVENGQVKDIESERADQCAVTPAN